MHEHFHGVVKAEDLDGIGFGGGRRVNIVRAARLQRSKDKQQSGEEEGKEGKMCIFQDICFSMPTILSKLDTARR